MTMLRTFLWALAVCAATTGPATARTAAEMCAKAGTVERWYAGGGFTALPRSGDRQYAMQLLGETLRPDYEAPRMAMFVDEVYYQFLFVPLSDFAGPMRQTDADLLAQHAEWELAAARKLGVPMERVEDLGVKVRPADGGAPATTFKLWRMVGRDTSGAQFYVTAVVGDEVAVMSGIVHNDPDSARRFRDVMGNYIQTLRWFDCGDTVAPAKPR